LYERTHTPRTDRTSRTTSGQ